jgi:adenylate cyclase
MPDPGERPSSPENARHDNVPEVRRRLAAILSADVEGYTRHVREDEVGTLALVKGHLKDLIEPEIARHGGRVFKTAGDGVFAEFISAVEALNCAVDIQKALVRRNVEAPDARQIKFRMGLNLGEVVIEGGEVFGVGVIVAERVQGMAEASGICVSDDVYRQVHGKVNVGFEDLGEQPLKNIAELTRVFRVGPPDAGRTHRPLKRLTMTTAGPMLAVLPFDNLSGDVDQGYFSDGITNDLITDLSRFPDLGVIASHSVFAYKGKSIDIAVIARELGVRYLVEGSVQRSGATVRINVQLIDGPTGRHLWGERYKRDLSDLFAVQDEIVRGIVAIVAARVEISELEQALRKPTESLAAYDHYLRGKEQWFRWTAEANQRAQQHFRAAIDLDAKFGRAYNALSYVLIQSVLGGWTEAPEQALRQARELAEQAVALGPSDFENHAQLAMACLYNRDFVRSIAFYEKALELNPNSADLLAEMADALVHVGRTAEGVAMIALAKRLNPICPDWYDWVVGIAALHDGRYEDALAAFMRLDDHSNSLRADLAATYVRLGRMEEAKALAAEMLRLQPNYRLATERLRPFKDPHVLQGFIDDLRQAGLPD